MTDQHELVWSMLADFDGGSSFHVVEWQDGDLSTARWVGTQERPYLLWLLRSELAYRADLRLTAVPYAHDGSYGLQVRGSVLWVRTDTGDSVKRLASFKPRPTVVLQEGSTNRMVAFWALRKGLLPDDVERANRRLSYALHTKAMHCTPAFRFNPPGVILRHGRSRPIAVHVAEQTDELHAVASIVKNLKDRPKPDPSKWRPVAA